MYCKYVKKKIHNIPKVYTKIVECIQTKGNRKEHLFVNYCFTAKNSNIKIKGRIKIIILIVI